MAKRRAKAEPAPVRNALPLRVQPGHSLRHRVIGLKVNDDEHELMSRVARERGFASVSDMLREAFNHFAGLQSEKE